MLVETNMNQYILLLHESPDISRPANMSPQRMQEIIGKYRAWRERLTAAGHVSGGSKLEDRTGRVMRAESASKVTVTDGPYAESKEVIGGFFILNAESFEDAVRLAQDCPHLEFGTIEVRRVEYTAPCSATA
jgi:hypothetical protein